MGSTRQPSRCILADILGVERPGRGADHLRIRGTVLMLDEARELQSAFFFSLEFLFPFFHTMDKIHDFCHLPY